jgi:hypothetical protein
MSKSLETIRARCALLGIVLVVTDDDHGKPLYVATRWAMTKAFSSLDQVGQWLDQIGGGVSS